MPAILSALRGVGSLVWSAARLVIVATLAATLGVSVVAFADYLATVPLSGTTFSSTVISTKHYANMVLCDVVLGAGSTSCASIVAGTVAAATSNAALVTTISPSSVGLIAGQSNASSAVATGSANLPGIAYLYGYNGSTWDQLQVDGSKNLKVTQAGSQSNASSAVATSSTNGQSVSWLYGFNGATWDQLQVDGSKNLKVLSVGAQSNASSAVATSSTSAATVGWLYGFNGTSWDQLQVDGSKFLKVTIAANATSTTDPCANGTHIFVPISQAASTQLQANGGAGTINYICGYQWNASDAENISLVEGTVGGTCGSSTGAIIGGTTAAAGNNFAANSGAAGGTGRATLMAGTGTNKAVCLLQSGSGRVAGFLNMVQQ